MIIFRPSRWIGILVSASLAGLLFGQQRQQPTVSPQLLNRAPKTGYVLGNGDQVNIHVVDLEEYGDRTIQIGPDGTLDLPLVGQVHASGKSLEEFKDELRAKLSKYINSPQLTVSLLTSRSNKVTVVGEVGTPGVRDLSGPTTLLQAISEAGGLKTDAGSKVIVTRSLEVGRLPVDGQVLDSTGKFAIASLNSDELMQSQHPGDNFLLQPGDIVSVPKAAIVYVVGDVHRSGGFPIPSHSSSLSVLRAISLAEGLQNNNASKNSKILRTIPNGDGKPIEISVNVKAILAGRAPDPPLFADDVLFIPHNTAEAGSKRAAELALQVATGILIYR